MWRFIENNNIIEKIDSYKSQLKRNKEKTIAMYKDDILIDSFYNVYEASIKSNKSRSLINRCIKNNCEDRNGYIWKSLKES